MEEGVSGGCQCCCCAGCVGVAYEGGLVGIWEGRGVIVLEGVEDAVDLCTHKQRAEGE